MKNIYEGMQNIIMILMPETGQNVQFRLFSYRFGHNYIFCMAASKIKQKSYLGPVVQTIFSLTSWLVVNMLNVLVSTISKL